MRILITSFCLQAQEPWLLEFEKTKINPIMTADSSFSFRCPISGEEVAWQKADVFNPAAIVKGDKVFLLFREEDNPAAVLGGRTFRIGLAYSLDGIGLISSLNLYSTLQWTDFNNGTILAELRTPPYLCPGLKLQN